MRLMMVLVAYLASYLVAAIRPMAGTVSPSPMDNAIAHTVGSALLATPFVTVFAALPATGTIAYAERYNRHSALFHGGAGMAGAPICLCAINVGVRAAVWHGSERRACRGVGHPSGKRPSVMDPAVERTVSAEQIAKIPAGGSWSLGRGAPEFSWSART